jgi:hypothetical protein
MSAIQNPHLLPLPGSVYGADPDFKPDLLSGVKGRYANTDMGTITAEGTFPFTEINSQYLTSSENPFHTGYRDIMRNLILGRMRNNRFKMNVYNTGGNRNLVPKPQPTGSFLRPFTSSGNGYYGVVPPMMIKEETMTTGSGGSFRSRAGSRLGKELLTKRGQQLQDIAMMQGQMGMESGLTPLPDESMRGLVEQAQQPVPLPREQAGEIALDLIFNAINENVAEAQFDEIRTDDLRKVMNNLSGKIGLSLQLSDILRYYELMNEVIRTINIYFSSPETVSSTRERAARAELKGTEEGRLEDTFELTRPKAVLMNKIREILKVLIDTFNLQPRERSIAVRQQAREIIRRKEDIVIPRSRPIERLGETLQLEAPLSRTGEQLLQEGVPEEDLPVGSFITFRPEGRTLDRPSVRKIAEGREGRSTIARLREQRQRQAEIMAKEREDEPVYMFGERREPEAQPEVEEEIETRAARRTPARMRQATKTPEQRAEEAATTETVRRSQRRRKQEAPVGEAQEEVQQRERAATIAEAKRAEDIASERAATERLEALKRRSEALTERLRTMPQVERKERRQARTRKLESETATERLEGLKRRSEALTQRLREMPQTRTRVPEESAAEQRPVRVSEGYVQPGVRYQGRGRPKKYSTPEDFSESRRVSAQVQRKKKAEYKKVYDKAISEGLGGQELHERALELFLEAGYKPSKVFNFGLTASE